MHEDLVGYLLGALDRDAAERIEKRLSEDPAVRRELDRIGWAMRPLQADAEEVDPPAGLADRTIEKVMRRRHAERWVPAPSSSWRLTDLAVAASILLGISMIILPALNESRQQRAMAECSNNLRSLGIALESYSEQHGHYFPFVGTTGPLSVAGIFAPMLLDSGLITDRSTFICPESGDQVSRVYKLSELRLVQDNIRQLSDMLRSTGGSYGYALGFMEHGVYRAPRRENLGGQTLLLDRPPRPTEGDVGQSNSPNHRGRGQNALCRDLSVRFLTAPRECPSCDDLFVNWRNRVEPGLNATDLVFAPSDARVSADEREF